MSSVPDTFEEPSLKQFTISFIARQIPPWHQGKEVFGCVIESTSIDKAIIIGGHLVTAYMKIIGKLEGSDRLMCGMSDDAEGITRVDVHEASNGECIGILKLWDS